MNLQQIDKYLSKLKMNKYRNIEFKRLYSFKIQ